MEDLRRKYEELVGNGKIVFLVPQAREELERLVRFLDLSKNSTQWNILVLRRLEGVGIRSVTETIMDSKKMIFAFINIFVFQFILKWTRLFSMTIQTSCELRTESAPIESKAFAEEFHKIIDILRNSAAEVALYDKSAASDTTEE